MYEHAVRLLADLQQLEHAVGRYQNAEVGQVVVGGSIVPGTYWLPKVISQFRQQHADVAVHLQVLPTEELEQAMLSGLVDLGVSPVLSVHPWLTCERLGCEEVVIVASPEVTTGQLPQRAEELGCYPFICAPRETRGRKNFDHLLAQHGIVRDHVIMEIGHPEGVKQAVQAGLGLGLAYRWAVEKDLAYGWLQAVPIAGVRLFAPIYLCYRTERALSPMSRKFMTVLRQAFEALGAVPTAPVPGTTGIRP